MSRGKELRFLISASRAPDAVEAAGCELSAAVVPRTDLRAAHGRLRAE